MSSFFWGYHYFVCLKQTYLFNPFKCLLVLHNCSYNLLYRNNIVLIFRFILSRQLVLIYIYIYKSHITAVLLLRLLWDKTFIVCMAGKARLLLVYMFLNATVAIAQWMTTTSVTTIPQTSTTVTSATVTAQTKKWQASPSDRCARSRQNLCNGDNQRVQSAPSLISPTGKSKYYRR